jgi:hypothetical protein
MEADLPDQTSFEWDSAKAVAILTKHSVSFEQALAGTTLRLTGHHVICPKMAPHCLIENLTEDWTPTPSDNSESAHT